MSDDASAPKPAPFVGSGPNGLITEAEARALLDEQERSGMTMVQFARSKGFKPQRLEWWKSKFVGKKQPRSARTSRASAATHAATPRFVPVLIHQGVSVSHKTAPTAAVVPAPRDAYELALGAALTLRIPHDFHDDTLARIVRVLREAR